MTAYINDLRQSGFATAPVLIAADSEAGRTRAQRTIEAAGLRIGATLDVETAPERIEHQASASAVWIDLDEDGGPALDRLLDQLNRDGAAGRYRSVVAAPASLIDVLTARLDDSAVQIIVDGSEADRLAALATASTALNAAHRLSDVAADRGAERLRQLSDEVSRIATALARLSTGPESVARAAELPPPADLPDVSAETVRTVIRARRLRGRYFSDELFADPAWDMLLDLLHAEIAQLRVPVSSLCIAASVPATTALRWLKSMTQQGLFVRRADPHDARRVFVELAPQASQAMRRYFGEAGSPMVV
jgi:hypothetical protein